MRKKSKWFKTMRALLTIASVVLLFCACDSSGNNISKEDIPTGTYFTTGSPYILHFSKLEFFDDHVLLYYGDSKKDENTMIRWKNPSEDDLRKTGTYYGVYEKYNRDQKLNSEYAKAQNSTPEIAIKIQSALTDVDQATLEEMKNKTITFEIEKEDDGKLVVWEYFEDDEGHNLDRIL